MNDVNEKVVCKSLSIVNDEGKEVACLAHSCGGAGLWIHGPSGDQIAIYSIKGQTAVGFYDKQGTKDSKGMNLCLFINEEKEPLIQFRNKDGEAETLKLKEVQNLLD